MARLGDKNAARDLARQSGVPVVPGSEGLITSEEEALRFAHDVGFPVLIKAVAGGGGRGMRVASNDLALKSALQQARAEAEAAFGNGDVYLEKYIEHPRHVEVQVLADHARQRRASVGARLQRAAASPEADRGKPEHEHYAGNAHRDVRRGPAS